MNKRDYKKEYQSRMQKYKRFEIRVSKGIGEEFSRQLKDDNTTFSNWITPYIVEYISKKKEREE